LCRHGFAEEGDRDDPAALAAAVHAALAASRARIVLAGLEDLWAETEPQNVPGTGPERANWRRVARHPLEKFSQMDDVLRALRRVNEFRKGREGSR
ncbi:MAG: 4-alpha-glucanotransferase, partial [Gemmatimonadota bacterium]